MSDHTATMPTTPDAAPDSGRHPVNVAHLVMGVAFLGIAVVWAFIASDTVQGSDVRWLMPIPWVAAGIAGVVASILPSRRHRYAKRQTGWVTPDTPETTTELTTETTDTTEENR
jgi:hypothetical protein